MKNPELDTKEKTLLVGFPSNGLVGTFTTSYLIYYLKMKQIGEMDIPELPATLFVENGEILAPIRIYNKENFFVILSDVPFNEYLAGEFANNIHEFCKKNSIKKILIVSGMETINPQEKDTKIYALTTHTSLENILYTHSIPKFLHGSIFGTDASIISIFRKTDIPALVLYAECHPFFPDPEASISATIMLSKILDVKINTLDIQKKIEKLKIQYRNLMEETVRELQKQDRQAKVPQIYK